MRIHRRAAVALLAAPALLGTLLSVQAQDTAKNPSPGLSWIIPDVVAAARAEGSLTVYSSMNEQEGLPLWKMLLFGSVGISAQAPHPKAALLGANFILSREAELFLTKRGRMPTRPDVPVNPAHVSEMLKDRKIIATIFAGEEQKKWQGLFKEIFRPR